MKRAWYHAWFRDLLGHLVERDGNMLDGRNHMIKQGKLGGVTRTSMCSACKHFPKADFMLWCTENWREEQVQTKLVWVVVRKGGDHNV